MKKKRVTLAACIALFLACTPLLAQDYNHDHGNHYGDRGRDHRDDYQGHGMYDRGRHEGWYHRGGRVPPEYRGGTYIVNDWRASHLRPPPRGYHWVRSDNGDFLLVAATTGIIASILAHQ